MSTNYDILIPKNKILLSIKDINDLGIIKSDLCKKLIYKEQIEVVKLGVKNFITRIEVIRYLKENTIPAKRKESLSA